MGKIKREKVREEEEKEIERERKRENRDGKSELKRERTRITVEQEESHILKRKILEEYVKDLVHSKGQSFYCIGRIVSQTYCLEIFD